MRGDFPGFPPVGQHRVNTYMYGRPVTIINISCFYKTFTNKKYKITRPPEIYAWHILRQNSIHNAGYLLLGHQADKSRQTGGPGVQKPDVIKN